jgi:hypothetical protein
MSLRQFAQRREDVTTLVAMAPRQRFVLVESGTELELLKPYIAGRAQIKELNGRPKVQEAWRILESRGACNFLALIDADFDEVVGRNRNAERLIYVSLSENRRDDTIDLEATLIRTRALQNLCEMVVGEPLCHLGGPVRFAEQLRESTRAAAAVLGAFRAAVMSVFEDCGAIQSIGELSADDWAVIVDGKSGEIDRQSLESVIQSRVRNTLKYPDVRRRASDFEMSYGSGWLLCRGHDMTEILALRFSCLTGRRITRSAVEKVLCENYRGDLLRETAFGVKVHEFCDVALTPLSVSVPVLMRELANGPRGVSEGLA